MRKAGFRSLVAATGILLSSLSGAAPAKAMEKLNVATASNAVIYGPFWVALADKLFEKHGVDVNVVSTSALSTGSAMLVSGHADLVVTTAFLALRIATEGKPLKFIVNLNNMGIRVNAVIARPDIKSLEELAAKGADCKVIMTPVGSASWANYQGLAARYNLKCAVSTAATSPLVLAGATSGQFDAAMVNPQEAYAVRDAGKANVILDPLTVGDELAGQLYQYRHPLSTVCGMGPNLESKREAVSRFVAALREATAKISDTAPDQLGTIASRLPDVFGTTPASALALQWKIQQSLFPRGPDAGFIGEAEWKNLTAAAPAVWGFANLKPDEPTLRYQAVVDMSYFNAAAKL